MVLQAPRAYERCTVGTEETFAQYAEALAGARERISAVKAGVNSDLTTHYTNAASGKDKPSTLDRRLAAFEAVLGNPDGSNVAASLEDSAHGMLG